MPELIAWLPIGIRGVLRGKITLAKALLHPHKASKELRGIFEKIESKPERYELNLYVSGEDEDIEQTPVGVASPGPGGEASV